MQKKYKQHIDENIPGPGEYKINIDASYAVYF